MNKPERKASRKDSFAVIAVLSYVCSLIFRIPLLYMIGEKGIACFGIANEIYVLTGCLFTYGLSRAVHMLIRFRIKREQYKNAGKVLRGALILALLTGIVLGITILAAGSFFANNVVGMPLAGLAVSLIAPAVVFQLLTGVFRGYFEGNGSRVPSMHSVIIQTVLMITGGLAGAVVWYKYGVKVSALLRREDYASAYGAMGACIGILAASFFGFLHMLLLFFIYRGNTKRQEARDSQRNQDKGFHIIHMLIGTAVPFAGFAVLFRIVPFLDGILFIRTAGEEADAISLFGSYYGKYVVIIGTISLLIALSGLGQIKKIIYYMDREEFRMARDKMGLLMHQTALISIPAAVFAAVLSENILNILFKGNNESTAQLVSFGSVIIVMFAFSRLFSDILVRLNNMKYVIGYEAAALVLHVILLLFLLKNTGLSITAVVIGNILFFAVLMTAGFLLTARSLQYRQEWLHAVAFTIVDAAVAGIVIMLVNRLLSSFAGTTIAFVICLPLGILIYMILLVVTKAVTENELENMAGGRILLMLGRKMRLM